MTHPAGDQSWLRSWWIVLPLFPIGWFAWIGFLYAGLRARRPRWIAYSAVYLAATTFSFIYADAPGGMSDAAVSVAMAAWAVGSVHAFVIRREYLERRAVLEDPRLLAAKSGIARRRLIGELALEDPRLAQEIKYGRPDLAGSLDAGVVDLNHAPVEVVSKLAGIDDDLARKLVTVREEIDGFSSVEDLGLVLDLPADVVDGLRPHVVFLPR